MSRAQHYFKSVSSHKNQRPVPFLMPVSMMNVNSSYSNSSSGTSGGPTVRCVIETLVGELLL